MAVRKLVILALQTYRWIISPAKAAIFGPVGRCRFVPSCSEYGLEAVRVHGVVRGGWLTLRRLCRCHPFGGSGYDPVPGAEANRRPVEDLRGPCMVTPPRILT